MLKGRLGLETGRIPHSDRHGLIWLDRGYLSIQDGCVHFHAAGSDSLPSGHYDIPHQGVSMILLGPGSTVSHDALRILAKHGTALAAIGEGGIRFYTAQPLGPDASALARSQAMMWASEKKRLDVARRMYAWRLGTVLPHRDIAILRGIEGAKVKEAYKLIAQKYGIQWSGRRYDRMDPNSADLPNQSINHASSAIEGAAAIAVAATGTIPQLGFIHEDSGQSLILDIADLSRERVTIPCAFQAVALVNKKPNEALERTVRKMVAERIKRDGVISDMIDKIKMLFEPGKSDADDGGDHP